MIWFVFALMSVLAAGLVLWPLLRRRKAAARRADYDLEVYRDQLAEVDRDSARGVLSADETEAARTEISRRILSVTDAEAQGREGARAPSWLKAAIIAILVPGAAIAVYSAVGTPGLPDQPFAERRSELGSGMSADAGELTASAAQLAARLERDPGNIEGWLLLARSYLALGRYSEGAEAYSRAVALGRDEPLVASAYGEALVLAAGGMVTPKARSVFQGVLAQAPMEPRARYYIGLGQAQAGRLRDAMKTWTELAAASPADAPWLPVLRDRIDETAAALGIDAPEVAGGAAETGGAPPPGPSAADVEAATEMSGDERTAMIRSMVARLSARLENEPDDASGWRMLARSYSVLGQSEEAVAAYRRAAALAPDDVALLVDYGEALIAIQPEGTPLSGEFVKVMREVIARKPDQPLALWFLGVAESEAGNTAAARSLWQRLLTQMPEGTPERGQLEDQIRALGP